MSEIEYQFKPTEHPALPGGPYTPAHPPWRRGVYLGVALMTAISATLGNGLVSTNLQNIAGSAGEYVVAVSILPAIYVAFNATGNLSMVKTRIRWGIPAATQGALALYAFVADAAYFPPHTRGVWTIHERLRKTYLLWR